MDNVDKVGNTPLHLAIKGYHIVLLNLLLNEATANLKNLREATPLHVATEIGNFFFVDLLLKSGAKVDEQNEDGKTPLHIVAGKLKPNMQIIMILLNHGASVHASCKNGYSPLHYVTTSGSMKITEVLIDHGASTTLKVLNGISPLCLAIQKNKTEMVKYMLKQKADVQYVIPGQMTPLHFAAETGNEDIVKLLITEEDPDNVNARGEEFKTPLHLAVANGHTKVAKYLIQCEAEIDPHTAEGYTPLHLSVAAGNLEIISELLDHGANIHSFNTGGLTPLALATKSRNKKVVRLLLNKGASATHCQGPPEYLHGFGIALHYMAVLPAFHVAAKTGDAELLKIFLNSGVEVDFKSKNNKTALHFAAACGHRKLVEELIKAGADINSRTKFLETPLHLAAASGRVSTVEYLLNSGAEIHTAFKDYTPLHYALDRERHDSLINPNKNSNILTRRVIRASGADNDSSKEVIVSPFLFEKYLQIAEMLLIKGASADSVTAEGYSPLDYAFRIKVSEEDQSNLTSRSLGKVNASEEKTKNEEFRPEIVRYLLNYGAKMNFGDIISTVSSLREAIKLKCLPLIDILFEYDINYSFKYRYAFDFAHNEGELSIILAIAEKISDMDTIVNWLCDISVFPGSIRFLRKDVSKLLIAILVKMRSTSKIPVVAQSKELKFLKAKELLDWYTQCELEVMNLRGRKNHQGYDITFYEILTKPVIELANYARNKSLMQILDSGSCKQFAAYAPFLERSIEKGKARKELIELSSECFLNLIKKYCEIQLPDLIVDKILEHLSVIELRKLSATIHKKSYN